jgi:tRNA(adenine34) deaminase
MCAGALVHARVKNLVFAARDPKAGAVQSIFQVLDDPRLNHRVNWEGGILGDVSGDLLRKFFLKRR